jgi:hypothetical protein
MCIHNRRASVNYTAREGGKLSRLISRTNPKHRLLISTLFPPKAEWLDPDVSHKAAFRGGGTPSRQRHLNPAALFSEVISTERTVSVVGWRTRSTATIFRTFGRCSYRTLNDFRCTFRTPDYGQAAGPPLLSSSSRLNRSI